jgi:hypothetical protein
MKSKDKTGSSLTHGIASENCVTTDQKSSGKQSHFRPWNRHCNMSSSWRMEWTASKNSRPTRETDSKNRFMFDAWNRQTHYASADPEIDSENWVTVKREINFKLSHGWRMESTAHTNSRLTNEIKRQKRVIVDAWNREWKLRHYNWPKIVSENKVTVDLEIATEISVAADIWSRQRQRIHDWREKPIAKIDSCLTHGIVKHTMPVLIHKSTAKTESL